MTKRTNSKPKNADEIVMAWLNGDDSEDHRMKKVVIAAQKSKKSLDILTDSAIMYG